MRRTGRGVAESWKDRRELLNRERSLRMWWIALAILLAGGLLGLFDGALATRLKFDPGEGEFVSRLGYWLGQGTVQGSALAGLWLLGVLLARSSLKAAAGQAFLAFAAAGVLTQVVKHLVGRPRPRLWADGVSHFGPSLASGLDSFPSGHAATSVALALVLAYHYPKASPLFMGAAAFVCVARIMGGSHFPLDVMGGTILGLVVGWAVITHFLKRERRLPMLENRP